MTYAEIFYDDNECTYEIFLYGDEEPDEDILCSSQDDCWVILAKKGFIPVSETFFYKP